MTGRSASSSLLTVVWSRGGSCQPEALMQAVGWEVGAELKQEKGGSEFCSLGVTANRQGSWGAQSAPTLPPMEPHWTAFA